MKHNCSEEHENDKFDLLLQINIEDTASRKSSNENCASSNIDHDDLLQVTILPSEVFEAISPNRIASFMTTLNTINEQISKRDRYAPSNKNAKENEITYVSPKESSIYRKSNNDNSRRRSFNSDTQFISISRKNENRLHDRMKKKRSKRNTHIYTQTCKEINDTPGALFIELGAVYKVLDLITDFNPKVLSSINNYWDEISNTLQCLFAQHHEKKLEDLLLNDSSLHKCKHCGVISYMLQSHLATEEIKGNRTKARYDAEIRTAERINSDRNMYNEKLENSRELRIYSSKADHQAKYKVDVAESLPIEEHGFTIKSSIKSPNGANNISNMEVDTSAQIKNKFLHNNDAIKRLFTDLEIIKRNKKYEYRNIVRNNHSNKYELTNAMKTYLDIDKEQVVRKISYEPKSQIDDLLAGDWRCKTTQKIQHLQRLVDKHGDIHPVVDTVKYLARGQFTILDKEEDKLLSKLQESHRPRLEKPTSEREKERERSSVLYSSRDDYPQYDSGFWLFDESGQLPERTLDEYHYLPISKTDSDKEDIRSSANITQRYNMKGKGKKTDDWSDCMEKDSLEDCTLLGQRKQSNITTFSSSSAENLIHEWMCSLDGKDVINNTDEDLSRSHRLVSSKPSLDIARHVRAQIADDRRFHDGKRSMRQLGAHDSDVLFRLSPEIRRKICHLIKKIISNFANDPIVYRDSRLAIDVTKSEKLLRFKSNTFINSNKCFKDNSMGNFDADDCIPTRLSELSEDKNRLQDNFINTFDQDLNKSKDSIKISLKTNASVSLNKSANNSTNKITRQIIYKDMSLKSIVGNDNSRTMTEILSIYRKILDNSKDMDWDKFRELIETLHPDQKELWCDICKTINEEAKKIAGETEVCIEISPVHPEAIPKTSKVTADAREIVFELNMTLKDVESFFDKRPRLVEKHLDTHKNVDEDISDSRQRPTKDDF